MTTSLLEDVKEVIDVSLAPLTTEQYHQMIDAGILEDGKPIELIEGVLVYKDRRDESGGIMTHGARHVRVLNKLMALLSQWVAGRAAFLQVQSPIILNDTNEPEPDCSLVRGTPDDFVDVVPGASDVLVVFEVAHSSLRSDRRTKQRLYASAGIPVYVILNLRDNVIEVMSESQADQTAYTVQSPHQRDETVTLNLDGFEPLTLAVNDLL